MAREIQWALRNHCKASAEPGAKTLQPLLHARKSMTRMQVTNHVLQEPRINELGLNVMSKKPRKDVEIVQSLAMKSYQGSGGKSNCSCCPVIDRGCYNPLRLWRQESQQNDRGGFWAKTLLTYPSEKYEFGNWDDDIPNIWKNNSHVPVTTNQIGQHSPLQSSTEVQVTLLTLPSVIHHITTPLAFGICDSWTPGFAREFRWEFHPSRQHGKIMGVTEKVMDNMMVSSKRSWII